MGTNRELLAVAASSVLLGCLALGCSGSTTGSKPDALSMGSGGQVGTTNQAGGTGAAGHTGGATVGTTGIGAGNNAGSVALPQDGGAVDAARDGGNDVPTGNSDARAVDSPLDTARNPDGTGDAARDRIPTTDTRDSATVSRDTPPDGSSPCGECLLGLTCGGGGVVDRCGITVAPQEWTNCSIAGWCSELDRPVGLSALYARNPGDIWAAGRSGQIAHFDGTAWTTTSGVIQSRSYSKSTSGALDSVYNNAEFTGVWVGGPSDVWLIASGVVTGRKDLATFVLRGDGTHWNVVLGGNDPATAHKGIWGTGPDDVWVAQHTARTNAGTTTYAASIAHWNGTVWTTLIPPDTHTTGAATGIWGLSANDIYLTCQNVTWHFDGATWTTGTVIGKAIWGSSPSSLWVVTENNQLFHSIGASWVQVTVAAGCGSSIWGVSESSLWFGGCYYDGVKWTYPASGIRAVHGPTATGAVGLNVDGSIVNLTPTTATNLPADVPAIVANDVAGSGPHDVWIVGSNGKARALHWDGGTFNVIDQTSPAAFTTVSVLPDNDVWAGATTGLWRLSGSSFVASTGSPKGSRQQLWGASKSAIWAVTGSDASISFFDGTAWQALPHGLSASSVRFASVWGSSASDIWVAGSSGISEHWNGTAWTAHDAGTADLLRVWGTSPTEVFVASAGGDTYAWDGSRWALSSTLPLALPPSWSNLVDYRACAANDVWVSLTMGYSSSYLGTATTYYVSELGHFDGATVHVYSLGELEASPGPIRIYCAAPGDVWMAFGGSSFRHLSPP